MGNVDDFGGGTGTADDFGARFRLDGFAFGACIGCKACVMRVPIGVAIGVAIGGAMGNEDDALGAVFGAGA
jgi:alpha/beta superfamily hydrolase